jgi:hypothetical protein
MKKAKDDLHMLNSDVTSLTIRQSMNEMNDYVQTLNGDFTQLSQQGVEFNQTMNIVKDDLQVLKVAVANFKLLVTTIAPKDNLAIFDHATVTSKCDSAITTTEDWKEIAYLLTIKLGAFKVTKRHLELEVVAKDEKIAKLQKNAICHQCEDRVMGQFSRFRGKYT